MSDAQDRSDERTAVAAPTPETVDEALWTQVLEGHRYDPVAAAARRWRRHRRRELLMVAVVTALLVGGWLFVRAHAAPLVAAPPGDPPAVLDSGTGDVSNGDSVEYDPGAGTGPGLDQPGVLVQVDVQSDGSMDVVERVRFQAGSSVITLAPPLGRGVPDDLMPRTPRVAHLRVTTDGSPLEQADQATVTRVQRVSLPPDTRVVELRYRLLDTLVRVAPSGTHSTQALLPPITTSSETGSLPVVVDVDGPHVLTLTCPALPAGQRGCGRHDGGEWLTTGLVAGRTAVLAILDLPARGD